MADLTKCSQTNCPMADKCYRVQAESNPHWQSWSNFKYVCNELNGFESFIPYKSKE